MALKQWLLSINERINEHAKKFAHPYLTFAIFGIITYPLYYFIWRYSVASEGYESLGLRLIVVGLCIILALKDYWPKKLQVFFPLYWYLTLLYSLPFLFTFLILQNNMSYAWAMNTMTILVLAILLLDLLALAIILTLGILLGILAFVLTGGDPDLPANYMTILVTYASVVFFGALFSYRKDQLKEAEKRVKRAEAQRLKLENEANRKQLEAQQHFNKIAQQVAHDIRSPLASLLMIVKTCTDIPEMERIALREASSSINDIADNLLREYELKNEEETKRREEQHPILVSATLLQILTHKKFQYLDHSVKFNHEIKPEAQFAFIECDLSSFSRMISNIINNAIDAFEDNHGEVEIILEAMNHRVKVHVKDTGKGIPPEILKKIEEFKSVTAGKHGGHGIGLMHARETLSRIHGSLLIETIEGKGTDIILDIPRIDAPVWIAEKIGLNKNDIVIILDDDRSIHGAWDLRLNNYLTESPALELKHFQEAKEAIEFIESINAKLKRNIILLTDYELVKQSLNGLDVIKQSKIDRSFLVTSHYMDVNIQNSAVLLGTKILPKQLASEIPIVFNEISISSEKEQSLNNKVDVILIDDDEMFAQNIINYVFMDNSVEYFKSPEAFIKAVDNYSLDTKIYLDNTFNESTYNGMQLAQILNEKRFEKIYLLTGSTLKEKDVPSYIKVIRKDDIENIKDW